MNWKFVLGKLGEYWLEVGKVSRHTNRSRLRLATQVMLARVRYGLGIEAFKLYRLHDIPVSQYGEYMFLRDLETLQHSLNGDSRERICDDKLLYHFECIKHKLPVPEIIANVVPRSSSGTSESLPLIHNGKDLTNLLKQRAPGSFLFKPIKSSHGADILRISFAKGLLLDNNGETILSNELIDKLLADRENHYILQPALKPHPDLHPVMPGPELGTFRMVVSNRLKNSSVDYACVKIPLDGNIADNFHAGRSGNIIAGIDISSGMILEALGPAADYGGLIERKLVHPVSGSPFSGFVIPQWNQMLELVKTATTALDLLTAGWDVALTEQGPCLIEVNNRWDVEMLQATLKRGLKRELTEKLQPITECQSPAR